MNLIIAFRIPILIFYLKSIGLLLKLRKKKLARKDRIKGIFRGTIGL